MVWWVLIGACNLYTIQRACPFHLYRNTLRVRFELGLFDDPDKQPLTKLTSSAVGTEASAELNVLATAESLVLLKNHDSTLPLTAGVKIAVVGPHANATRNLIQVDGQDVCVGDQSGTLDCVETPFEAIRRVNAGGQTALAVGCDIMDERISTAALLDEAVAAASAADVVVMALGIAQCGCSGVSDTYMGGKATNKNGCGSSVVPPYTPWGNCWDHTEVAAGAYIGAEAHDRILIDLPPVQRAFAAAIFKLKKKTVVFLLNGGSIDVGPELEAADAVLEAFYPGQLGASSIANALFARGPLSNKFGRMPYTMCKGSQYPGAVALVLRCDARKVTAFFLFNKMKKSGRGGFHAT